MPPTQIDDDSTSDDSISDDDGEIQTSYSTDSDDSSIIFETEKKCVTFSTQLQIHIISEDEDDEVEDENNWVQIALDRLRFEFRIKINYLPILQPILEQQHRQKIFAERFQES